MLEQNEALRYDMPVQSEPALPNNARAERTCVTNLWSRSSTNLRYQMLVQNEPALSHGRAERNCFTK